jgi:hypothetical protein
MLRQNWNTDAPMLMGASSFSRLHQRTTNCRTSTSDQATPARATTAEIASMDTARAMTNGARAAEAEPKPSCQAARAIHTTPATERARPPQCGSSTADAASFTGVRLLVWSSAIGRRQMLGEMTFANPDAASSAPYMPMNCHPDHGATPPTAVAVTSTPMRFTKERTKTRASPRNALPDRWRAP